MGGINRDTTGRSRGREWTPHSGTPAAHPNGQFTSPAVQCTTLADNWEAPEGVAIDAIVLGGRHATNVPLVAQAEDWAHGVFFGATVASEQTAAAEGPIRELRFDPFAMLPFCGYDMADYWRHWLTIGEQLGTATPAIIRVNWFRKDSDGQYLWSGIGDNIRVLEWTTGRLEGGLAARATVAGRIPEPSDIDLSGLSMSVASIDQLLAVGPASWSAECEQIQELFDRFGDRVPAVLGTRRRAMQAVVPT